MIRRDVKAIGGWSLYALLLLSVICAPSPAKDKKEKQEAAEQLLAKARAIISIEVPGSPPFLISAHLKSASMVNDEAMFDGTWRLFWESHDQWREDISLPGYREVSILSGDKFWNWRSIPYKPFRAFQLSDLVDLQFGWKPAFDESAVAVKEKEHEGIRMQCVELKAHGLPSQELCSDAATLLPAFVEHYHPSPEGPAYDEYTDYMKWGGREFPQSMHRYEGKRLVLAVRAQIEPAPKVSPSFFTPPAGAVESERCEKGEPALKIRDVPPVYPVLSLQNREEAVVSLYAVIRADGTLGDLTVVRSAGTRFDAATLEAVRHWRYRPAMCGARPVEAETLIDVRYTVSR